MIRMSAGLKNALLTSYGLADMMDFGVIDCYTGFQPDSATHPATGTHLGRITNEGKTFVMGGSSTGLKLDRSAYATLKDARDWRFTATESGRIGWWRWRWSSNDPDTDSLLYPRVDGLAGESLVLESLDVLVGQTINIEQFHLQFEG